MLDALPALLSKVRMRQHGGHFLVVDVDLHTKTLELLSLTEPARLIEGVALSAIQELVEGPPDYL